jgi:type II secretory pathway pseudopilin PulG
VNSVETANHKARNANARGFSVIELMVVVIISIILMAIALYQIIPAVSASRADVAMREVVEQIRQARELSIENRRYVQIQFNTATSGAAQIVITQLNHLTANAGADAVVSTVVIEAPFNWCVCGMPDTADAYGNGGAIYFEGLSNGPTAGMEFQSDGELIDSATNAPINGTVFVGTANRPSWSRAVTVLGTTGRVRTYRSIGSSWVMF